MKIETSEPLKKSLEDLNLEIASIEMAEKRDDARKFFERYVSDQLIFRRASGKVVGKSELDGFLEELKNKRFKKLDPREINVTLQGDRALVTLILVVTEKMRLSTATRTSIYSRPMEITGFCSFGITTKSRNCTEAVDNKAKKARKSCNLINK